MVILEGGHPGRRSPMYSQPGCCERPRIFSELEAVSILGLAYPFKNGPTRTRVLSTSTMRYVSKNTSPLRVPHWGSIDAARPQSLDGRDISMDDGELPQSLDAAYACTPAYPAAAYRPANSGGSTARPHRQLSEWVRATRRAIRL